MATYLPPIAPPYAQGLLEVTGPPTLQHLIQALVYSNQLGRAVLPGDPAAVFQAEAMLHQHRIAQDVIRQRHPSAPPEPQISNDIVQQISVAVTTAVTAAFSTQISTLENNINDRLNLAKLDIDQRFNGLEERFNGLEERFNGIEQRFNGIEQRFIGIDTRMGEFENKLDAFRTETEPKLTNLETTTKRLETTTKKLESKLTNIETATKTLENSHKSPEMDARIRASMRTVVAEELIQVNRSLQEANSGLRGLEKGAGTLAENVEAVKERLLLVEGRFNGVEQSLKVVKDRLNKAELTNRLLINYGRAIPTSSLLWLSIPNDDGVYPTPPAYPELNSYEAISSLTDAELYRYCRFYGISLTSRMREPTERHSWLPDEVKSKQEALRAHITTPR
ncbi:hypothetical protein BDV93DRAFT_610946 [Ceratobasidium sp. AG-I]|nr:hypothetical protein BDV93DRAFT_610946 [Ceratobasidium sp. AG-I]